jgi:hypothetical protein
MTAAARVALVVDNTRTQKQRSKRSAPTQSFLTDKHPIYGGKAEIVRTQQSGGYWHFRMWISEESKYVRKTLKTKHLDTAIERAENEFFAIKANLNSGKRIFSPTLQHAAEDYLKHRWEVDVKRGSITEGRWGTIKSQLNHFVAYCGIVGRSERSSVKSSATWRAKAYRATSSIFSKRAPKTSLSKMSNLPSMPSAIGLLMKGCTQCSTTVSQHQPQRRGC